MKLLPLRKSPMPGRLTPAGVALLYATFAALWIVISGHLLTISVADPVLQSRIGLVKGLVFVAVTSALLYLLLRVRGAANLDDGEQPLGARRLLLIFTALALVVPLVGFAIARLYGPQIEREAYANLEAIARLKAEQMENWMGERYGDSAVLAGDDAFVARVSQFVQHEQDTELSRLILGRFEQLVSHYHYTKILLLDANGRLLLKSGEDVTTSPVPQDVLRRTLDSKQVQRSDIYLDEEGHIHIEWAVPLIVSGTQGERMVAVVVLRVTAQQFIFPLIQTWPTASPSGETLLVRREGGSVLFLNELRHHQGSALRLALPLDNANLPAAIATREDRIGTVAGVDYRGVSVLAAYRPVAGANWHIVAKIDRDEVLAPLRDLALWISLIALVAIVAVGAAVMLLWRQQQRSYQMEMRARSMAAIEESERHFRSLFDNMLNGFAYCRMLYDGDGRPVDFVYLNVNAAFERITGLKNVLGKPVSVVIPGIRELSPELFDAYGRVASTGIPETFEFDFKSQSQWYYISVYSTEKEHFVAVFDDITERKAVEAKIQRLTQLYAALSQSNEAIVRCTSADELFPQVCRSAVQFGGMKMAWIGMIDEASRIVRPVTSDGDGTAHMEDLQVLLDGDSSSGGSLTRIAIRDKQPQWCQDFQHDPLTAPWHERGASFGWGSAASLPLLCNGAAIGAFTLYSGTVNAFDEAARKLLIEMALDLSFALDNFAREDKRKQAELELTASERHFHSLFENMLGGYVHCKMLFRDGVAEDFVYLEVNHAFETLSGLKDVVGKRASEVTPGIRESNPELFETYSRVTLNGQPELFEMYLAGLEKWFSISVYCPEKEHFVAIFDNITAHKKSERVLAESEQRFRSVVEQSLAGIYIIQDGRFVYVNPRFAEIFGYASVSELIGVEPTSLVAEQDRATVAENIRSRIEGGAQSISYGFTAVRKDGSLIDVGVHGARATHGGHPAIIGLMQDVSEKKRAEEQIQRYVAQLEHAFMNTIEVVTTLVEMRDPYTAGHEKRVALIATAIGTEMGLDTHRIEGLRVGGYVHDIGKIIVPAEILSKPGKISAAEYELIKGHPKAGYDILKNVDFPWPVADIAHQHHERMDGSGYPRGLKGDEILLEARIIAVADVIEAMSAHRPYRPGFGIEKALEEIERRRGSFYDPQVVDACLRLFREQGYVLPAD